MREKGERGFSLAAKLIAEKRRNCPKGKKEKGLRFYEAETLFSILPARSRPELDPPAASWDVPESPVRLRSLLL